METIDIIENTPTFTDVDPAIGFDSSSQMYYKKTILRSADGAALVDRITGGASLTFKQDGEHFSVPILMGFNTVTDDGDMVTLVVGTDRAVYHA